MSPCGSDVVPMMLLCWSCVVLVLLRCADVVLGVFCVVLMLYLCCSRVAPML